MPGSAAHFVCAPPGTGLRAFCQRLSELGEREHLRIAISDVEDHLPEKITFLVKRPRQEVVSSWHEAFDHAADELEAQTDGADDVIQILCGHLTLYNAVRSEFYSPISPSYFAERGVSVARVSILIDDIYDMFRRLRDPTEVIAEQRGLHRLLGRSFDAIIDRQITALPPTDSAFLQTEFRVEALIRLLAWRRAEMIQAELLARQLGCSFLPIGVKHTHRLFRPMFADSVNPARTVYISHPISRPRKLRRDSETWHPVVAQCNDLPTALSDIGLLPIMPTAIDELRFTPAQVTLFDRAPMLEDRWPAQTSARDAFFAEDISWSDNEKRFLAEGSSELSADYGYAFAAITRQLETAVYNEIPFRDHLLVASTRHLFVFRPLFLTGGFSRGVEAEINHWAELSRSEVDRRAAFVHTREDLEAATDYLSVPSDEDKHQVMSYYDREILKMLREVHGIDATEQQLPTVKSGRVPTSELEAWDVDEADIATLLQRALAAAALHLLFVRVTNLSDISPQGGVFVAFAGNESRAALSAAEIEPIGRFLRGEESAPDFGEVVGYLFDDDPASWARRLLFEGPFLNPG